MNENSSDTVGNRTRDLLACNAVPEPTALPRAPMPYIPVFSPLGLSGLSVVLTTHLHLVPKIRMSGGIIYSTIRFHGVDGDFTSAYTLLLSSLLYNHVGYVFYIYLCIKSVWV